MISKRYRKHPDDQSPFIFKAATNPSSFFLKSEPFIIEIELGILVYFVSEF